MSSQTLCLPFFDTSSQSVQDEQPEVQGPGLWLSTEKGATASPIDVYRDGDDNIWEDDEFLSGVSPPELNKASDLDREWQTRHNQFHTVIIGFKQSVFVGDEWGIVRGVTSVLASLPDELKEKLINSQEKRNSFQSLYKAVHSLSTSDALRLFNQDINNTEKQNIMAKTSFNEPNFLERNVDFSPMRKCIGEFQMLLSDSPSFDVHFPGYQ